MEKASTPSQNKEKNSRENGGTQTSENRISRQGVQCRACHHFGHIAKNCKYKQRRGAEAPEKSQDSSSRLVTSAAKLSDEQLEEELNKMKLDKEQG